MHEIELSGCPLQPGTPLKVSTKAWGNWGIEWQNDTEFQELVNKSEEAYDQEWTSTSGKGLRDIARAAEMAGLGDANKRLNDAVGTEVGKIGLNAKENLCVVDLGAGSGDTTMAVLRSAPQLKENGRFCLVDPAKSSLQEARSRLAKSGLIGEKNLEVISGKDLDALQSLPAGSVDLVVANAALHHHAFLNPVFQGIARILRPGGWLVIGDWHCTMWLKPIGVLKLLDGVEWPGKAKQLAALRDRFRTSDSGILSSSPELAIADQQIGKFWLSYAQVKDPSNPPFLMLEGHRPAGEYVSELAECGIRVRRGPIRLLPGSELLSVLVAQKE